MRAQRCRGFTLMEVLIGTVLFAVLAAGAMMAIMSAGRMSSSTNNPQYAEASALGQQTLERLRSFIGCDYNDPDVLKGWFSKADCSVIAANLPGSTTAKWQHDDPVDDILPGGTLPRGAKRCYEVKAADCDGDSVKGDCLQVDSQVCWGDMTGCLCP